MTRRFINSAVDAIHFLSHLGIESIETAGGWVVTDHADTEIICDTTIDLIRYARSHRNLVASLGESFSAPAGICAFCGDTGAEEIIYDYIESKEVVLCEQCIPQHGCRSSISTFIQHGN